MILVCFGTRPEWLKIKSILPHLNNYKLLFTGQHTNLVKDIKVDYKIKISKGENRLDSVIASCLRQFPKKTFKGVLVQGDTASAFACALAAFNRKIPIFYVEAGLRTYDLENPYPEEGYRQMISRIATYNFHPTELGANNHSKERLNSKGYVVGNTVLDNIKVGASYTDTVLVTLHRRENHEIIGEWFKVINSIAVNNPKIDFILPLHPNPNVQKHKDILSNVKITEPLNHNELLDILAMSKLVITDSGGIQEEGSYLNKKVIVCRKETERPEGIYTGHITLCKSPDKLEQLFNNLILDYNINTYCPYGDGKSGKRIAEVCNKILN